MHLHEQGVSTFISMVSRQHGVADGDTSVRRFLQREGEQFHMDAEVECLQENHFSQMLLCLHRDVIQDVRRSWLCSLTLR